MAPMPRFPQELPACAVLHLLEMQQFFAPIKSKLRREGRGGQGVEGAPVLSISRQVNILVHEVVEQDERVTGAGVDSRLDG